MTYNVFSGTLNPTHFTSLSELAPHHGGKYQVAQIWYEEITSLSPYVLLYNIFSTESLELVSDVYYTRKLNGANWQLFGFKKMKSCNSGPF